ncbi:hypothetical protein SmJEL517_g03354 [Synchytrium microbalum]|uniref:Checkpoint protein n=1 Tax=Synchytrium microbalum TaxID=1806994 RepID=A0A507C8L4_9FUNG|nr:uncharacterized protein SmJEL517_g03354 [Synchytrium microbalum]TPX33873.1 hypothetical protein SmJEL517_g03354 [Synchytrium microbalum]
MRLKAKVANSFLFARMCQSLEKLSKTWVLRLTPDRLHFIVAKSDVDSGLQVWGQVNMDAIFEDTRIESAQQNEIWLELSGEFLHKALKSTFHAHDVVLKLTKKDDLPVLSFVMSNQSRSGKNVTVMQDVPVRVMTPQQTRELREPTVGNSEIYIMMPPLTSIKTIVEKMKSFSNFVTISANNSGDFHDSQKLSQDIPQVDRDPALYAEARIDVRDFIKFLQSSAVNPKEVVCCILDKKGLVIYVYVSADATANQCGSLTYYMPARSGV